MIAASSGPPEPEPEEVTFKTSLFTPCWGEGPRVSSGALCFLLLIPADPLQPRGRSGQPGAALPRKGTYFSLGCHVRQVCGDTLQSVCLSQPQPLVLQTKPEVHSWPLCLSGPRHKLDLNLSSVEFYTRVPEKERGKSLPLRRAGRPHSQHLPLEIHTK